MNITTALLGYMARSSSGAMEDVRDRLRAMVESGGEETVNDPLGFLYQGMYDAIEVLDTNIEGAYKEEKIVEENKRLEKILGK